jgi:hypothetical protein
MFSITLKRSGATLGVLAGLLAAAAAIEPRDADGWPDGTQHNSALAAKVTVPDIKLDISLPTGVAPSSFGGGLSRENF